MARQGARDKLAPFLLQTIFAIVKTCAKAAIVCKNLSECAHARKPKEQESVANLTSDEEWNETLQTTKRKPRIA